jgi:hypothetical protein
MKASEDFLSSIARGGRLAPLTLALGLCSGLLTAQSKLPPPKLDPVFNLHLQLSKPTDVGQTSPAGLRRVVTVLGGTLEGTGSTASLKGKILPGADYQIIRPDGFTEIDAHYVVQMESGDLIYVTNRGMRHGPPELIAKLNAGESVDQSKIYFRTIITIETAAKTLDWMSRSILVSVGERQPSEAVIHVYRLN